MAVQINLSNEEFQPVKQRLPDNILSFVPKTGTTHFDKSQAFEIAIPRTNHIIRLNKACFEVEMVLSVALNSTESASEDVNNWYFGMNNAACIFDQVFIKNNGRTFHSDTYSQVSSRLWQMQRSTQYLNSMYSCFLNYEDISKNIGFTYFKCADLITDPEGEYKTVTFRMRIPLGAVFSCFDTCDNFPTSQLVDDIVMLLQLSDAYKYLTLVHIDDNKRVDKVMPFELAGDYTRSREFAGYYLSIKTTDSVDYSIQKFKMLVPCHYPTPEEKEAMTQLVAGGSVSYPFKSWEIDSESVNFANSTNRVGTDVSLTNSQNVNAQFASNSPNLFGLMILFTSNDNRVVFEKPYIKDIECNLNEIIKLANNRVHTDPNYTGDNDMYRDLCVNFGVDAFKNLSRIDDGISHDYANHTITSENLWGSYCQWYQIAAGNQLGFSGDYFANLINYKCTSLYDSTTPANTPNNHDNSYVICCGLSQRMLLFKDGGVTIVTPFSEELNMRNVMSDDDTNQSHGAITKIISSLWNPIKDTVSGVKNFFQDQVFRIKGNKNSTYAYSTLGKDGYNDNKEIIEQNLNMNTRKFRDFIDRLKAAQHGLFVRHGVGTNGYTGGLEAPISTAAGIPRAKDVLADASGNRNIDNEKGLTLEDLNLPQTFNHTYQLQVYSKDYKNQILLDYKFGMNHEKLKLQPYGSEMALGNMSHGFRSWLKDKWQKFKSWIKPIGKQAVENLASNAKEIVKQYVQDILSGKLNVKDIPSKFRGQVEQMIREGKFTGTEFDKLGSDAMDWYHKLKSGQVKPSDIPSEIFNKIKDLSISMSGKGSTHGLFPRHGFLAPMSIHASIPRKNMKVRIAKMLDKSPQLLSQKELRNIYMYKYQKEHQNDGHGISKEVWRKLKYGNHNMRKPVPIAPANNLLNMTRYGPYSELGDRYKNMKTKYKEMKKKIKASSTTPAFTETPTSDVVNDEHGMNWSKLSEFVRKKLKKMGYKEGAQVEHGVIDYIQKKMDKKKRKKGLTNPCE